MTIEELINKSDYGFEIGTIENNLFKIRHAVEKDFSSTTELIHEAFGIWKKQGLNLKPIYQTIEETKKHLLRKGCVVENSQLKLVATFSLEKGLIKTGVNNSIEY